MTIAVLRILPGAFEVTYVSEVRAFTPRGCKPRGFSFAFPRRMPPASPSSFAPAPCPTVGCSDVTEVEGEGWLRLQA